MHTITSIDFHCYVSKKKWKCLSVITHYDFSTDNRANEISTAMNLTNCIEKKVRKSFKNSRRSKPFQLSQQIAQHTPLSKLLWSTTVLFLCPVLHVSSWLKE